MRNRTAPRLAVLGCAAGRGSGGPHRPWIVASHPALDEAQDGKSSNGGKLNLVQGDGCRRLQMIHCIGGAGPVLQDESQVPGPEGCEREGHLLPEASRLVGHTLLCQEPRPLWGPCLRRSHHWPCCCLTAPKEPRRWEGAPLPPHEGWPPPAAWLARQAMARISAACRHISHLMECGARIWGGGRRGLSQTEHPPGR